MEIIALVSPLLIVWVIVEISTRIVYGRFLDEGELDVYFGKYLASTYLNKFNDKILSGPPKYVSRHYLSVFGRWHVSDHGVVPYWSKWNRRLDARRSELLAEWRKQLTDLRSL